MQYHFRMQQLFTVDRMAFSPPPRVESAIVRFRPHQRHPVAIADETTFARVVREAFNHRRKTLRNALHGLLDATTITSLGIDPRRRPDTLSLAEFARISRALASAPDT